jgi:hypothetical protein
LNNGVTFLQARYRDVTDHAGGNRHLRTLTRITAAARRASKSPCAREFFTNGTVPARRQSFFRRQTPAAAGRPGG